MMKEIMRYDFIACNASLYKLNSRDNLHPVKDNNCENIIRYNVKEQAYYLNDLSEKYSPVKIIPIFTFDDIIEQLEKVIIVPHEDGKYYFHLSYNDKNLWCCYYQSNQFDFIHFVTGTTQLEAVYKQLLNQIKRRK